MIERERRFLIENSDIVIAANHVATRYVINQGYIAADETSVVRLRSLQVYGQGHINWYMTIKRDIGEIDRVEEYEFFLDNGSDPEKASAMFASLDKKITKTRYAIKWHHLWIELDIFHGVHDGLVIAEVELANDEEDKYLTDNLPKWFGEEITGNKSYSNYQLCKNGLPNA